MLALACDGDLGNFAGGAVAGGVGVFGLAGEEEESGPLAARN